MKWVVRENKYTRRELSELRSAFTLTGEVDMLRHFVLAEGGALGVRGEIRVRGVMGLGGEQG